MTAGMPRKVDVRLRTTTEATIAKAVAEVEQLGADPALTDAVNLLGQAADKVAAYVDAELEKVSRATSRSLGY